jgi:hypothetical protein
MEVSSLPAVIRLNVGSTEDRRLEGLDSTTAAARAIGCEVSTLSRILKGERSCGGEFIANLLVAAAPVGLQRSLRGRQRRVGPRESRRLMDSRPLDDPAEMAGRDAVKDWPPLTEQQLADLAVIFGGQIVESDAA